MEVGSVIKLRANDKTELTVTSEAAKRSKFISDLLIDFKDEVIDVSEADGKTLKEVIEYLEHYKDKEPVEIPKPLEEDERLRDLTDPWDVDFVERTDDVDRLMSLIIAADYMGIHSLHELMCCQMACVMLDLGSAEKIIKHFGIEEDMTEEEARELEKKEIEELKKEKEEEFRKQREQMEKEYEQMQAECGDDEEEEEEEDDDEEEKKEGEGEKKEVKEEGK